MSTTYTPTAVAFSGSITVPVPGEQITAALTRSPLEQISNGLVATNASVTALSTWSTLTGAATLADNTNYRLRMATGTAARFTLPAAPATNSTIRVRAEGLGKVILLPNGKAINGRTVALLATRRGADITLVYDGTGWYVTSGQVYPLYSDSIQGVWLSHFVTDAGGAVASAIEDLSGNGYNLSSSGADRPPIAAGVNGHQALQVTNHEMSLADAPWMDPGADYTITAGFKTASTARQFLIHHNDTPGTFPGWSVAVQTTGVVMIWINTQYNTCDNKIPMGYPTVATIHAESGSGTFFYHGTTAGAQKTGWPTPSGSSNSLRILRSNEPTTYPWIGDFYGVILRTTAGLEYAVADGECMRALYDI